MCASRDRGGSLRRGLGPYIVLRDGRQVTEDYAQKHYKPIGEEPAPQAQPRRKRTYDSLGTKGQS